MGHKGASDVTATATDFMSGAARTSTPSIAAVVDMPHRIQVVAETVSWHLDLRNGRIWWSSETYRMLGVSPERLPATELHGNSVHPNDRPWLQRLLRSLQEKTQHKIQYRIVVNGKVRWIGGRGEFEFGTDGEALAWVGSIHDGTNAHQREQELLESRRRLRELAARQERERETEKSRRAREMHDGIGQHITDLRMAFHLLQMRAGTENHNLRRQLGAFKERIDALSGVTRNVITTLRPRVLDEGLEPADEWLVREVRKNCAVKVSLEYSGPQSELAPELSMENFRTLQEALTNVARRANASVASVRSNRIEDRVELRVEDDGAGFVADAIRNDQTYGLISIRERALLIGGSAIIKSRPGGGTTILAFIPLISVSCIDLHSDVEGGEA